MKDASDNKGDFDHLILDHYAVSLCLDRKSGCVICYSPTDPHKALDRVRDEMARLHQFEAALVRRTGLKEAADEAPGNG